MSDESSEPMKQLPSGSASFELLAAVMILTAIVLVRVKAAIQGVREYVR